MNIGTDCNKWKPYNVETECENNSLTQNKRSDVHLRVSMRIPEVSLRN